ncbi:YopX family protein [Paucilactobacillus kaifaensis]|uniref:YopX family protein n=1 Tax=Paucilactobacillus kaifaensis TaxID=2559921 RepID=UPI001CC402D1|nr:YopX family protein [Paucilactobacillus kaifaensis]
MIKFRVWDNECKVIREYDELKGLTLDALDASYFKLEQFTGLKDVNGKEIYEGDIVHCENDYQGTDYTGKVMFFNG